VSLLETRDILATSSLDGHVKLWAVPLRDAQQQDSQQDAGSREEFEGPLSKFFRARIRESRKCELNLELIGVCSLHSSAVKTVIECAEEGFVSCGNDGILLLWKDSLMQRERENSVLNQIFDSTGWMEH
jgi:WD40 repeat protein